MKKTKLYLIGAIIILVLVILNGSIGISIAQAQSETTTPTPGVEPTEPEPPDDVDGIQFLDPEATLSYDYESLINEQKIQVRVLNNSSKFLTILGEVKVNRVFQVPDIPTPHPESTQPPTATPYPQPLELDFCVTSANSPINPICKVESIKPGSTATLEFLLKEPEKQPVDGTYNGFVILSAFDEKGKFVNVIQRPFTLQVGEKQEDPFSPEDLTITSSIEDLKYEFRELESGEQQVSVLIENKSSKDVSVNIKVNFPGIEKQPFFNAFSKVLPSKEETLVIAKLKIITPFLEAGEYDGHIILVFKDGSKIIKVEYIPIKLTVSSHDTGINQIVNRIQSLPQRWLSFKLGPIEWILLAAGLLFILRFVVNSYWWLRGKPGTVSITLNDQSGEDKLKVDAEKAVMQERLAKAGLLPPISVPGGSMGDNLIAVLEKTDQIPATGWLAPLIRLFQNIFKRKPDHTVNGTFIVREAKPQKGLTIELSESRTGRIEEIKSFWKETHREAVESAAYFVYHRISHHAKVLRRTPVWARFPSARIFEKYHCGLRLEEAGKFADDAVKLAEAKKLYLEAAVAAPNNATVRFRLGNLMETQHNFLDAIEYYLEIISTWPDQFQARYRLGSVFSFHEKLKDEWGKVSAARRKNLLALIRREKGLDDTIREWEYKNVKSDLGDLLNYALEHDEGWDTNGLAQGVKELDFSSVETAIGDSVKDIQKLKIKEAQIEEETKKFTLFSDKIDEKEKQLEEELQKHKLTDQEGKLKLLLQMGIVLNANLDKFFNKLARQQREELEKEIRPLKSLGRAFKLYLAQLVLIPWGLRNTDLRQFAFPAGRLRQFRRSVQSAILITDLRNPDTKPEKIKNIQFENKNIDDYSGIDANGHDKLWARFPIWFHGRNWQIRYNAACFYSIAMGIATNDDDKLEYENMALIHLRFIVRDPSNQTPFDWMVSEKYGDPDLDEIRKTECFKALFGPPPPPPPNPELVEVKALCHSWDVLAAAAKKQEDIWSNRWTTARTLGAGKLKPEEILPWIEEEVALWGDVHTLAADVDSKEKRDAFWSAIKKIRTDAGDQPKASMKCNEKELSAHRVGWNELYTSALALREQYQRIIENPPSNLEDQVFEQWVLWQALRYWAASPLEDALSLRFLGMSKCFDDIIKDRILAFFNQADLDEEMIIRRIHDDPNFGRQSQQDYGKGYGMRRSIAKNILNYRTSIGGKFTSLSQLDQADGVGLDTIHDILYSFSR